MILSKIFSFSNNFVGNIAVTTPTDERLPVPVQIAVVHLPTGSACLVQDHTNKVLETDTTIFPDQYFSMSISLVQKLVLIGRHQPQKTLSHSEIRMSHLVPFKGMADHRKGGCFLHNIFYPGLLQSVHSKETGNLTV